MAVIRARNHPRHLGRRTRTSSRILMASGKNVIREAFWVSLFPTSPSP
jgi:hypothetical protein